MPRPIALIGSDISIAAGLPDVSTLTKYVVTGENLPLHADATVELLDPLAAKASRSPLDDLRTEKLDAGLELIEAARKMVASRGEYVTYENIFEELDPVPGRRGRLAD